MVAAKRILPAPTELPRQWISVFEEAGLRSEIVGLGEHYPEERSLEISFQAIDRSNADLADMLLDRPEDVLAAGVRGMRELLLSDRPELSGLRLRVIGLSPTAHRVIREVRETDLGHFLALDGIVRKVTEVRPQVRDAVFECVACRTEIHESQDADALLFREPLECPEAQGGCGKSQGRTRFRFLPEKSTYVDSQRIEVQESPESLRRGAHPQGIPVLLTEDLAGHVIPGNRIVANGVLKGIQRTTGGGKGGIVRNTVADLMLVGNSVESKQLEYDEIEISEEEERLFRQFQDDPIVIDKIVLSLAPTIKGMEEEKEAIALQLFGGVEKRHPDGIRTRGDMHVLLVGDPGTAKSQLLRYIADVAPRGIYTSGKGATAAGLTAAAVKDDFAGGRWVLEAGMLVLADGGMAVVDELDKMTPEDRSAMHEALEQQTVSISKAGITATLNARCPVLAAANPKWGRFDDHRTIAEQIDLPATLLSRFDVIYSIKDRPNQERDRTLAKGILGSHRDAELSEIPDATGRTSPARDAPFSPDLLKKYVAYARRKIRPALSDASLTVLEDFYVSVRRQGEEPDAPVPITARQLEALVRMSEASARARLSMVVTVEDAQRATRIMDSFLHRVSTSDGKLDIDLVTTGSSRSQRERQDVLLKIMRDLQTNDPSKTFTIEQLKAAAEPQGIPEDRVDQLVSYLKNAGELFEPRPGGLQLVRF